MSRHVYMECPQCHAVWAGWVPSPRDTNFYERCQGCDKVVHFTEIKKPENPAPESRIIS